MTKHQPTFASTFTLGGQQAEADPVLQEVFFDTGDFEVIQSREDQRCFIVGRTGAGKSAMLQRLEELNPGHVIRINPEDLALPYITNNQAIKFLDGLGISLESFWITLWKHVLLVEIIRHRYTVNSPAAKQHFLTMLREKISKDRTKTAALEYLDEYEGRFWCETDQRIREITDSFTRKIDAEAGIEVGPLKTGGSGGYEHGRETRTEEVDRFQRIVNDTQLARLNKMIGVLGEDILDNANHFTYVVIDDLDRNWVDERIANDLVRCLFQTVLDLKRVKHLKVFVALRTNIFQELNFSHRGGGQEEKFRSLVLKLRWTKSEMVSMLNRRVDLTASRRGMITGGLTAFLPIPNKTRGNPIDYILERTLMRPRDAIAYLNECFALGSGKTKLAWTEIHKAEREYSNSRVLALRDEWKPTYPGIGEVIDVFKSAPARMTKVELTARLDAVALLVTARDFDGVVWLTKTTSGLWGRMNPSWYEAYQPMFYVLYEIGRLGCVVAGSSVPAFQPDQPGLATNENLPSSCDAFHIQRTFHLGLDVRETIAR